MLSFLTFYSSKNPENKYDKFQKILSSTTVSIIGNKSAMISEGSCDTDDWGNG